MFVSTESHVGGHERRLRKYFYKHKKIIIFYPRTHIIHRFVLRRGTILLMARWDIRPPNLDNHPAFVSPNKYGSLLRERFSRCKNKILTFTGAHHPQRADKNKLLRRRVSAKCHGLIKISSCRIVKGDNPVWVTRSRIRSSWNIFADYGPVHARVHESSKGI